MRPYLLAACFMISWTLTAQSWSRDWGFAYNYIAPVGNMQQYVKRGHGVAADFYVCRENSRFAFGAELSYTVYGHDKSRQLYTFDDGTTANMDIVVDNTITNLMVGGRFYLRKATVLRPYLSARAGYAWFRTDLNIYDPDEYDHCKPVDRDVLLKDGTLVVSTGAGVHYDLSSLFRKMDSGIFIFTMNANLVLGGKVNYMNTDAPHHPPPTNNDVTARFINTQTQVVHEHHVGYVYRSYAELVEVRAGFVFRRANARPSPIRY
jgi:hypothetical protein